MAAAHVEGPGGADRLAIIVGFAWGWLPTARGGVHVVFGCTARTGRLGAG